jgi:hypothetical protein
VLFHNARPRASARLAPPVSPQPHAAPVTPHGISWAPPEPRAGLQGIEVVFTTLTHLTHLARLARRARRARRARLVHRATSWLGTRRTPLDKLSDEAAERVALDELLALELDARRRRDVVGLEPVLDGAALVGESVRLCIAFAMAIVRLWASAGPQAAGLYIITHAP